MGKPSERNFVLQQGFRDASAAECEVWYPALMWQPRAIGCVVLIGLVLQAWPVFLGLSAVLLWNAALPRWNLFDALYNHWIAAPRHLPRLTPAPGPRRFAQAMAACFSLGVAASLYFRWSVTACVLEAFLALAVASLIFGRFCIGSYLFHLLKGERRFANQSLPWS